MFSPKGTPSNVDSVGPTFKAFSEPLGMTIYQVTRKVATRKRRV